MVRKKDFVVDDFFVNRWSPRALEDLELSEDDLFVLFEAARWAPSAYNDQPWRFVYSFKSSSSWNRLFESLVDFNKAWVKNASVLVVIISKQVRDNGDVAGSSSFDVGSAWQNFGLQAHLKGLVAHGIGGFDYDVVKSVINLPDNFKIEALIAVGKQGFKEVLPDFLFKLEIPSDRRKVSEFVFKDKFQ